MRAWAVVLLVGCHYSSPADPDAFVLIDEMPIDARIDAMPDPPPAARKRVLTIDPAKVEGNQTDFPVWISIANDDDLKSKAFADGSDIYFTTPNGTTKLAYEIERWDKAGGVLEAWVRSDLADQQPTIIELRYGDPGVAQPPSATQTFSNNFSAVWHLDDDVAATTTIKDALAGNMGTAVNGPTVANAGALGRGIAFDGVDDQITISNPFTGNNDHTISAWVKVGPPLNGGFSSLIVLGAPQGGRSRFLHTKYNSGIGYGFYTNDVFDQNSIDGNTFHLVHWTFAGNGNAGNSVIYVDGVVIDTQNHGGTINTGTTEGYLGFSPIGWNPNTNPLHGVIDEVRLATTVRPANWIKTEFNNQSSPATFYAVGPDLDAD